MKRKENLCASSCSFTGGSLKVMVLWLLQGQSHVCSRAGHTGPAGLLLGAPSAAAQVPSPKPQPNELCGQTGLRAGNALLFSDRRLASKQDRACCRRGLAGSHPSVRRVTRHAKLGFPAPTLQALASCKPRVSQKRTLSMALDDTDSINRHLGDVGGPWPPVRPRQCARSSARVLCVWYLKLDNIQGRAPNCGFLRARPGTCRPDSLGPTPCLRPPEGPHHSWKS